jgi:hypothetical protein
MFPPGRLRLWTTPSPPGREAAMTMGIVEVACLSAGSAGPGATIKSTWSATNSAARPEKALRLWFGHLRWRAKIDGVHGGGAPNVLNLLDAAGATTGELFPTGNPIDNIDGIEVSCVDVPSPL